MQQPVRHVRAYNNAYLRIKVPKKRVLPNADTTLLLSHVFHQSGHTDNLWLTFYRSFSHCITLTLVIIFFSGFLSYVWRIKFRNHFRFAEYSNVSGIRISSQEQQVISTPKEGSVRYEKLL